jgi:hypothetical protein
VASPGKQIEESQREFCKEHGAEYLAVSDNSKTGFAQDTRGMLPINGLRHPSTGDTSGWYIWCGEQFSNASDFFSALHTYHLYEEYPEIAKLLGLPPGYRFLLAGDYLDVWYDASLLNV